MKLNRQQQLLNEIAQLHAEWESEFEDQVEMDQSHSDPHDKETGASDYNQHYVARSASPEQEQVFQDRIAPLYAELEAITANAPAGVSTENTSSDPEMGGVSTSVDFHLAVNGDAVQMLVKHDFDEGLLSYREKGEWIPVKPGDELPALDEADLVEVIGNATGIWDEKEGGELTLDVFETVLLDEA